MKHPQVQSSGMRLRAVAGASLLLIAGCASDPKVPQTLDLPRRGAQTSGEERVFDTREQVNPPNSTTIIDTPRIPAPIIGNAPADLPRTKIADGPGELSLTIEQMPLPSFVQAVYGQILKANYSVDAAVQSRTELVTFRTPRPLSAARLAELASELLKSYGVTVRDLGGVIRLVPSANTSGMPALIRRGRASPSVPLPLRPIFYYLETEVGRAQSYLASVRTIMGDRVKLDADPNGVLISGNPDDVQAALELFQVFDQPSLRGTNTIRVVPRFWGAEEFARRLSDVLRTEGYAVGAAATSTEPTVVMAIPPINSVLIFSVSPEVLEHALEWVKDLDQLPTVQAGSAFFTYPVRNSDAVELAKSLNELISAPARPAATGGSSGATTGAPTPPQRRVVVNQATNSLIFQGGNQEDYRQWLTLLADLDRPVKSVLVDVLVAEVALSDGSDLGFAWRLDQLGSGARSVSLSGTRYDATLGGTGVTINALLGGNPLRQLAISALARDSNSKVISNPKVMTRNGESASINVGQDVPTITSLAVPTNGSNGSTGSSNAIPQTVQYRNTGVLLKVRPVVHASDRIDIEVSQEVSSAQPTTTGVTSSPTISRRSIDTKLTARDGETIMLGGLISDNTSDSNSGVPFAKDVPILGRAFRRDAASRDRTELVVMITPYIMNDPSDAAAATSAYIETLGPWADGVRARLRQQRALRAEAVTPVPALGAVTRPLASASSPTTSTPVVSPVVSPVSKSAASAAAGVNPSKVPSTAAPAVAASAAAVASAPAAPPVASPGSSAGSAPAAQPAETIGQTQAQSPRAAAAASRPKAAASTPRIIGAAAGRSGAPTASSSASGSIGPGVSAAAGASSSAPRPTASVPRGRVPTPESLGPHEKLVPPGSTVVEDPELIKELLRAGGKK